MLPIVHLASTQPVKIKSASSYFQKVESYRVKSGVSEQPFGIEEIKLGAMNRLNQIEQLPALSLETGIVKKGDNYVDMTICFLRTHLGLFASSEEYLIREKEIHDWLNLPNRSDITLGSLVNEENSSDWYKGTTRLELMSICIAEVLAQYCDTKNFIGNVNITKSFKDFNGVKFLDIQPMLLQNSMELSKLVRKLSLSLLFNKVLVLEARGFLLAGEFMKDGYPIVLARKPGKLPGEEISVEYKKEYGVDRLCIQKGTIQPNDRVIVLDDIIATGGTMKACEHLIKECGGRVEAFIAPFVITSQNGELMCGSITKSIRYYCDKDPNTRQNISKSDFICSNFTGQSVYILPPSLGMYSSSEWNVLTWGKYYRSSNIWFNGNSMKNKQVVVYLDPSNASESFDTLQLLSILHRKDPKKVIVVIPFLEQATQDRIEYKEEYESLAQVDTIAKILGKHTVYTFDLHAEQSQFAFHDLRCFSLVKELYNLYCMYNSSFTVAFPDEGSAKRFGKVLKINNPIIFSKVREGEKRFVKPNRNLSQDETQIVIIDDLVRSGGTMYEVANYLLNNGAKKVDALFAHAPFEPSASINLRLFRDVWTTNTCPQNLPREWIKIDVFDFVRKLID